MTDRISTKMQFAIGIAAMALTILVARPLPEARSAASNGPPAAGLFGAPSGSSATVTSH